MLQRLYSSVRKNPRVAKKPEPRDTDDKTDQSQYKSVNLSVKNTSRLSTERFTSRL